MIEKIVAENALDIGFKIREGVNKIPRYLRGSLGPSILKPHEGEKSKRADIVGESIAVEHLKGLSAELELPIGVIVDPRTLQVYEIGNFSTSPVVWTYVDPVDGTMKLTGLGNEVSRGIYRVGNNGCWAAGIAFTSPLRKDISELCISDFSVAAIVDGNPTIYRAYPTNAVCFPDDKGILRTFEKDENTGEYYNLATSSQENLGQSTITFDGFQAFDRNSASLEAEKLAVDLYRAISNRNEGGAFDIVRMYANMGEMLRQLLERSDSQFESQGTGAVTVNENLPNLVPVAPIIEGAGGYIVDFDGNLIRERYIHSSRPNVVIAANVAIKEKLLDLIKKARSS